MYTARRWGERERERDRDRGVFPRGKAGADGKGKVLDACGYSKFIFGRGERRLQDRSDVADFPKRSEEKKCVVMLSLTFWLVFEVSLLEDV